MDQTLKDFVSNQVSTYCDADPEILSNYVLALLNESKPTAEIKASLKDQLQEFFEDETSGFIDRLYEFMDNKSKAAAAAATSTTSTTTEASVVKQPEQQQAPSPQRTRATNFDNDEDEDDEEDGDRSFKHRRHRHEEEDKVEDEHRHKRRLSDQDDMDDQNKYRRSNIYRHPHRDDPKANDIPSGSASFGNRRGGGYQSRNSNYSHNNGRGNRREFMPKPMCRDFNEKGYCVRGDLCPFEHGKDTIVYEEGANNNSGNVNNSNNGNSSSNSNINKLNPVNPMMPMPPVPPFFDMPNMFGKDAFSPENMAMMQNAMAALPPIGMPNPEEIFKNMMQQQQQPQRFPYNNRGGGPMRRGRGGGMRGGRGGYGYNDRYNTNRPPRQQQGTTLVIDNIPPEHCQMTTINDYFKKFGSITNISLQSHKALVSFNTHEEAEAAHQSPDAIFDNRFVKVYWHKENTGDSSQAGGNNTSGFRHANTNSEDGNTSQRNDRQQPTDAPAPSSHTHTNEPDPAIVAAKAAELQRLKDEKLKKRQEHMQGILELQKQKEQLLQRQIDQQKQLLAKLSDKSLTLAQKEELLSSLKKIAADIDQSRSVPAPAAPTVSSAAPDNDSSDFLKEKLARLQAEAASLGISPDSANQPPPQYGGYYGRGGARGAWQPRGGMVKRSLDNRPTKVMIKDIPQETNQDDLKKYFEQFGQVVSFEDAQDGAIAHYSQRFEAEKAMAFGPNFPTGKLALSWYTNPSV